VRQFGTGNVFSASNASGTTALFVSSSGNVGIGMANPVYAMDITGDLNFTGTFRQNGTPYIGSQWTGTSPIYFLGNVGIGTASPATALDVYTGTMNAATVVATTHYGTLAGSNTVAASASTFSATPAASANVLTVIGSSTTGNVVQFSNTAGGTFIMTNAGRIGINTVSPSYTLDVVGNINFSGAITQAGSPLSASQWTGTSAIYFAGNVGIGTTDTTYPLIVRGTGTSTAAPYSNLAYQAGGWYQAYEPTAATTLKIYTDGKIGCTEVDVFSDARIKSDIQDSDSFRDLDTVLALRVREFRYKDPIEHGDRTYTGLVAQEVKEVFPAAVSTHEGVIPDVFQVPTSFSGRVCQFTNKIEGLQIGARVKVLDESVEKFLEVVRVSDFEIEFDSEIDGPKVFVYGQAVKDLHTVSYDRLVPVLISAVQELSKRSKNF